MFFFNVMLSSRALWQGHGNFSRRGKTCGREKSTRHFHYRCWKQQWCSAGMELASVRTFAFDRLLCLVEALRDHHFVCEGLHTQFGLWLQRRGFYQTESGKIKNSRCKDAKCETRRALRHSFHEEVFSHHDSRRAHMVLLHQPLSDQAASIRR